ncbi:hypothetical protein ABZ890_39555 [Streptomyces sp. NPDC046984]|uniref:hypothetical protein n=1 Tax=Streptomyces sp. NPDC046984 TaxID=3155138 RepID=UPI003410F453
MKLRRALRQIIAPNGHHRGRRRLEETTPPTPLLRPIEAMANDIAYCPAEERERLHAFLTTGGRVCWTCRHFTPHGPFTSTPPSGGAE